MGGFADVFGRMMGPAFEQMDHPLLQMLGKSLGGESPPGVEEAQAKAASAELSNALAPALVEEALFLLVGLVVVVTVVVFAIYILQPQEDVMEDELAKVDAPAKNDEQKKSD